MSTAPATPHALAPLRPASTPRQHAHAAQGDRYDVTARRRDGAIARTYGWDAAEPPRHVRTQGVALFRIRVAAQTALWPMLALCGHCGRVRCVGTSKRKTPTNHALAPPRSARHSAQPVMPLGLGVVAWWRCGASARTYRAGNVGAPRHGRTPGAALFRLWTGAKAASRPMLAICGRRGRVGCIGLSGHDPHPSRVSLEAGRINRMATRHVERVVVVGANARTYEQRMDRRMRRTKIRQGDALEVPSERRITIRTTTALTNTSLKGFCICSSCRRCGCRYKVTNRTARALALGLNACSPSSLGRGALPVVGRHPNYPTVHL